MNNNGITKVIRNLTLQHKAMGDVNFMENALQHTHRIGFHCFRWLSIGLAVINTIRPNYNKDFITDECTLRRKLCGASATTTRWSRDMVDSATLTSRTTTSRPTLLSQMIPAEWSVLSTLPVGAAPDFSPMMSDC